jgi:hypothetical protein
MPMSLDREFPDVRPRTVDDALLVIDVIMEESHFRDL